VAPLAAKYEYAMFGNKDLLLLQDGIIADAIHLNRRLSFRTGCAVADDHCAILTGALSNVCR
jgi:hypothetical protein